MQFLLECIGFPPDTDLIELARWIGEHGDPVAWRGPTGRHLQVPFPGGLEVRLDQEEDQDFATLWPFFDAQHRLRVALQAVDPLPDSPYDVVLRGTANPPSPGLAPELGDIPEHWPISTYVADARRIPCDLTLGHVLAVSIAGFSIDVSYIGPCEGARDPAYLERPHGAFLEPLDDPDHPRGCMQLSARVRRVRWLANPISGENVAAVEIDVPGRPIDLFLSPWQLAEDGLPAPRPGCRIEGVFLFTGRVSGGLPPRRVRRR